MDIVTQVPVEDRGAKKAKGQPKKQRNRKRCEHNKQPSHCRACLDAAGKKRIRKLCKHSKEPHQCRACLDAAGKKRIMKQCEHNKQPSQCRACLDAAGKKRIKYLCKHGKTKYICSECLDAIGKKRIRKHCVHGKLSYCCIVCRESSGKGQYIPKQCPHSKRRSTCVDCRGRDICPHGRQQRRCPQCLGNDFCKHRRIVYNCKICNDCGHGNVKMWCSQCPGGGQRLCSGCRLYTVSKNGGKCRSCNTSPWHGISKERVVGNQLIKYANDGLIPLFSSANKKLPRTTLGTGFRPDFYYDMGSFALIVEVDENQHDLAAYTANCELVRNYRIAQSIGLPLILVRYNPDGFKIGDSATTTKVPKAERHSLLLTILREHFSQGSSNFLTITYLFYDQPAQLMNAERHPYCTTAKYLHDLDYEQFVGAAYPEGCTRPPPDAGTKWYSKVD